MTIDYYDGFIVVSWIARAFIITVTLFAAGLAVFEGVKESARKDTFQENEVDLPESQLSAGKKLRTINRIRK